MAADAEALKAKVATLTVINGALQRENDQLRARVEQLEEAGAGDAEVSPPLPTPSPLAQKIQPLPPAVGRKRSPSCRRSSRRASPPPTRRSPR
jgi:hypothetical protein